MDKRNAKKLLSFIPEEKTPNEDRLVMLCDGVFAIAITLLVIDIGINPRSSTSSDVTDALGSLIQPTISYLVTFFIIAVYWRFHRTLMQVVEHLDNTFISLTFLFLAFIAFFPVTSKLVGDYGDVPSIIILYTLGLSGCSLSAFALWFYATWKHRLIHPDVPQEIINTRSLALLMNPIIYCVSLLLLLVVPADQPYLICFSWILVGYTQRGVRYIYQRWLAKPVHDLIHHDHSQPETPLADRATSDVAGERTTESS